MMPSERRKRGKSKQNADNEYKNTHCNHKRKSRGRSDSKGSRLHESPPDHSALITTKRLSIGLKGIFGYAKSSNSVYRDIQKRMKTKHRTKNVASEIEHSLSQIISKSYNISSSSSAKEHKSDNADKTRTSENKNRSNGNSKLSTPASEKCYNLKTPSNQSVEENKTPFLKTTSYIQIAQRIKENMPMTIFEIADQMAELKKEIIKSSKNKCSLNLHPTFERENFRHLSGAKFDWQGSQGSSQSKCESQEKAHGDERSPLNRSSGNMKDVPDQKQQLTYPNRLKNQNSTTLTDISNKPEKNTELEFKFEPNFLEDIEKRTTEPFFRTKAIPFSQNNIQYLLNQPINSLRCDRRLSKFSRYPESHTEPSPKKSQTDFLDYIDSIPIQTLEKQLLTNHRLNAEEHGGNVLCTVLEKPTFSSPSPPKYYRMSMF